MSNGSVRKICDHRKVLTTSQRYSSNILPECARRRLLLLSAYICVTRYSARERASEREMMGFTGWVGTLLLLLSPAVLLGAGTRKLKRQEAPTIEAFNVLSIQGPSSTQGYNAVRCGGAAARPSAAQFQFGDIYCFDMPLLRQQDLNSELLGRVQGTFTMSQLTGGRLFVAETFILNGTSLQSKGSFSALGMETIGQFSSKPITGGTDDFELVTGNAFTTPLGGAAVDIFGNSFFWFKYKFVLVKPKP